MHEVERDRRIAGAQHRPHGADVAAPKHPHRRAGGTAAFPAAPFAIQEALHIGQKGHELVVVAFVKTAAVAREFVHHFAPGRGLLAHVRQQLPGFGVPALGAPHRHQAQGPQQDLAKLPHAGGVGFSGHGWPLFWIAVLYKAFVRPRQALAPFPEGMLPKTAENSRSVRPRSDQLRCIPDPPSAPRETTGH
ncbi:hypothetical protein D3C72_1554910 [compost metagenome]